MPRRRVSWVSSCWTTASTCLRPLRGGTNTSTSSVKPIRPTRSLLRIAEKAKVAARRATRLRLSKSRLPRSRLADMSTTSMTVSSRSSANSLTCGSPVRAVTFQSIVRTSSPGVYWRTSEKATPWPLKTD